MLCETTNEMEMAVISSLVNNPGQYHIIGNIVSADTFYNTKHQYIYKAIELLINNNIPLETISIKNEVEKQGGKIQVTELHDIISHLPTGELAEYYAEQIRLDCARRRMKQVLLEKIPIIDDKQANVLDLAGDIQKEIADVVTFRKRQHASVYPDILDVWEEYIDVLDGGDPQWITTGLIDLDKQVCLVNGTHTIVGASPAEGKTSLGVCILRWVSTQGKRCAFFSLEQTRKRILQKIISQEAKVSHKRYITGRLTESEKAKVTFACNKWSNKDMCVIDGRWSVAEIRQRVIQEKAENGLDMLIVDLLGLLKRPLNIPRDAKDHIAYNESSKQLQDLAAELDIPIITMAHLNREKYKRPGNRPILSDLREAGEQFADIVMFIHREFNITKDPDDENVSELIIAKNRDGMVGYVKLGWHGESTTFHNLSRLDEEPREERIVLGGGIQND